MSFFDKFKKAANVAADVGKIAGAVGVPGAGGVAQVIEAVIANPNDKENLTALRQLAAEVDVLRERVSALEKRTQ